MDPEAAELDQEEAGGAEPLTQLELAILNGLDISSLPALRDLSTRASTTVHIPWPPVGMERATPEWRWKASQAMAFLLGAAPPYGQARRMGLTGPWAHENAEWLPALLGHAGIRNGIGQTFHLRARGSSGTGGSGLKGV